MRRPSVSTFPSSLGRLETLLTQVDHPNSEFLYHIEPRPAFAGGDKGRQLMLRSPLHTCASSTPCPWPSVHRSHSPCSLACKKAAATYSMHSTVHPTLKRIFYCSCLREFIGFPVEQERAPRAFSGLLFDPTGHRTQVFGFGNGTSQGSNSIPQAELTAECAPKCKCAKDSSLLTAESLLLATRGVESFSILART